MADQTRTMNKEDMSVCASKELNLSLERNKMDILFLGHIWSAVSYCSIFEGSRLVE